MNSALAWIAAMALAAAAPTAPAPDFSGHWKLVSQETEAFHGRAAIGNHEEPVRITQTTRLSVSVESADPTGRFENDLTGARVTRAAAGGDNLWTVSRWDGATLVTEGRRQFTTPKGPRAYDFSERRRLSGDGMRMIVQTRIEMFPKDLVRSSEYRRID